MNQKTITIGKGKYIYNSLHTSHLRANTKYVASPVLKTDASEKQINQPSTSMKMTSTLPNTFFLTDTAFPTPPDWQEYNPARRDTVDPATRATGRFEIHDTEGYAPEIICRVILGLSLVFAFIECFIQLAAS